LVKRNFDFTKLHGTTIKKNEVINLMFA